jgi:hypothetical protein
MIRRNELVESGTGRGMVELTFTVPAQVTEGPVSVVGDFNDWDPRAHPMTRQADGSHSTTIRFPQGITVCFRYLAHPGHWFDDPDVNGRDHRGGLVHIPQWDILDSAFEPGVEVENDERPDFEPGVEATPAQVAAAKANRRAKSPIK